MTKQLKTGLEALSREHGLMTQEKPEPTKKEHKSLFIGIPKETAYQENRVSLTPEAVGLLVNNGHEILIEAGAGERSNFGDNEYSEAGARICYDPKQIFKADIILKVEPLTNEEMEWLEPGKTLFSAMQVGNQTPEYLKALINKKITAIGFEYIEDKVGGMPVVRAMSEIAGSTVMLIAAEYLSSVNRGMGIILGGITGVPPTKVVIIGAGTVGEYAARTAIGLGAEIEVYDNQIYKLRRIKHALGQQVFTSAIDTVRLGRSLETADVVIGAVRAEKGRNKIVVTDDMVSRMKQDSVIVDVSIDQGGCFETSRITTHDDPIYRKHGVLHYCVPNIASRVARTATEAFSNIFTPILLRMGDLGGVDDMIFTNPWFMKGVYAYRGSLTNKHLAQRFNLRYRDLELLITARF
ncbi:alanine dehydrogenase [Mangrovivirga cuniculi]|uniref:alanine dehydrogenase n=1 Tax=Mangrovivirga cuniculi TaxID=2715131 RepID=A0A4D7JNR5_9BACT|nr:alanine dehydrogenase [Mangrovivirga cuniculi]